MYTPSVSTSKKAWFWVNTFNKNRKYEKNKVIRCIHMYNNEIMYIVFIISPPMTIGQRRIYQSFATTGQ